MPGPYESTMWGTHVCPVRKGVDVGARPASPSSYGAQQMQSLEWTTTPSEDWRPLHGRT